jgi:uncharacterized protein YceH (UPF0502 family)
MAAMALSSEEARVLACLVEKESTVPDSYPLTLNALRLACNQTSNRHPIVSYEDRAVEAALLSLKSIGLVRFVHPSHGGRTVRYRHVAGERWHLEHNELAVLAVLVLRGPQTAGEVKARVERQLEPGGATVEEALDTLAARSPEAFAVRLERRPDEREARWAHLLAGEVEEAEPAPPWDATDAVARPPAADGERDVLVAEVAQLRRRLDRLEELLGVEPLDSGAG